MHLRKMVILGALAALAIPGSSLAATGKVDATAKTADFNGTITSDPLGVYEIGAWENGGTEVAGQNTCVAPACDEHTLTVGEGGAQLKLDATSDAFSLDLEIVDPDGYVTTYNNWDSGDFVSEQHLTLDATPGDWTVRVYGAAEFDSFDYSVTALFRTPEDVAQDPVDEEPAEEE